MEHRPPAERPRPASGSPDAVKVGTVKRAKGLEFKMVLLPRALPEWVEPSTRDDEADAIHRREIYVGMTCALDQLWVGVCSQLSKEE